MNPKNKLHWASNGTLLAVMLIRKHFPGIKSMAAAAVGCQMTVNEIDGQSKLNTVMHLARSSGIAHSTVHRLIQDMVMDGLTEPCGDPNDARRTYYLATEAAWMHISDYADDMLEGSNALRLKDHDRP